VKWLIGRPQEALLYAKAKRQQMFYLCESEASATIILSVRKRSDSNKCFICAKAKRQQQLFYLCESVAQQKQSAQPKRKSTSRYDNMQILDYRQPGLNYKEKTLCS